MQERLYCKHASEGSVGPFPWDRRVCQQHIGDFFFFFMAVTVSGAASATDPGPCLRFLSELP